MLSCHLLNILKYSLEKPNTPFFPSSWRGNANYIYISTENGLIIIVIVWLQKKKVKMDVIVKYSDFVEKKMKGKKIWFLS